MDPEFNHIDDTDLDPETKRELQQVTQDFFERPLEKAEDFDWDEFKRYESFKAIMMPSPLFWTLTKFERSFTQKLGQQMYEHFGRAVADANDDVGSAETQYNLNNVKISASEESVIESIISSLDGPRQPDWEQEKQEVLNAQSQSLKNNGKLTWDLWINNFRDGRPLAAEIKTPKPNKDQTMESKRQMLQTVAAFKHRDEPTPIVRFVFPFNPYGSLKDYNWWPPQNIFNVKESDGMMIDKEFWNSIGGPETMAGLYNFLLDVSENNIEKLEELAGDREL